MTHPSSMNELTDTTHVGFPPLVNVYRRRDLLAQGISDDLIASALRDRTLIRLRHGIYVNAQAFDSADEPELHRMHLRSAVLASKEPVWALGPSAGLLHGLPLIERAPETVHLLRIGPQDHRSLRRPSKHDLIIPPVSIISRKDGPSTWEAISGIPTVDVATAAMTAAPHASFRRKVGYFDAVRWLTGITQDELLDLAWQWRFLGEHAATVDAIALSRSGAQSYLETISRLVFRSLGIPEPMLQVEFHDRGGLIGYVDMYWPEFKVVGEADGAMKYGKRQDVVAEKRREDRLRALGLRVVRWMWEDIIQRPEVVAQQLRHAFLMAA